MFDYEKNLESVKKIWLNFLSAANVHSTELRFEFKPKKNPAAAKRGILIANLTDKTAKLSMMTYAF